MLSKKSFFNRTLFRKNLTRFWPLWAMPSFIGALFPLAALTQLMRELEPTLQPLEVTSVYYEVVNYAVPIISLCYAVLVALAVWSYLFNPRSTGLMHTLPLRREGLFLTNFLSGMAMMLIPYAVTGALCILIFSCFGGFEPVGILVTILCIIADSLFYFASATLMAFISGNLFAMPVLYFIFHFFAVGADFFINVFAQGFLFGLSGNYTGVTEFLSPTVYLVNHVNVDSTYVDHFVPVAVGSINNHYAYETPDGYGYYESELVSVTLENSHLIAIYALVGIVLLALAFALYRKRRSESAGDVVAVGWMKPIFRYGVTVCGSMVGGMALYYVFWYSFQRGEYYDLIPMIIAMLIAGAISYYAASWKGLAGMAAAAIAICCVLEYDLFGVESRVPEIDDTEYVTLYVADNHYTFYPGEEDELLEQVRALHLAIAQDKDYIAEMQENRTYSPEEELQVYYYNTVRMNYYLKNGTSVLRRYSVPVARVRLDQPGTYDYALDQLVNGIAMKQKRLRATDSRYRVDGGSLYLDVGKNAGGVDLSAADAQAILNAITRDAQAGNWGTYNWFPQDDGSQYAMSLDLSFSYQEWPSTASLV